jgi:heavy metal translocating P-type ATPase
MGHSHAGHSHDHDHKHDHGHDHGHEHSETYIEACNHEADAERHMALYLVGAVCVVTTPVASWLGFSSSVAQIPAWIGSLVLAYPLLKGAWEEIRKGKPGSSTLVGVAILAAIADKQFFAAGILAFVLLFIGVLIRRTAFGAQRAIAELVALTPDNARIVVDGVEQDVKLVDVKVGMTVRVRAGENLPVDGKVVTGRSTINQASLTGESVPVEVQPGDPVYAGTSNLTGMIDLMVTQVGAETTIGKVTSLISKAEQTRSPRQLLIEQVARFFVPIALSVAAIVWFIKSQSEDPAVQATAASTAITVLVVTCPVALILSSPTAMLAAFAACARLGILVKDPAYLEAAGSVDTVVLDKTGTITTGKFQVTKLAPAAGVEGVDLLRAAASAEQQSNHPLAQSIVSTANSARVALDHADSYEEIHGRGVRTRANGSELCVGRGSWLLELNPSIKPALESVEQGIEGMTGVHVMKNGQYLGAVGLEDTVRANAKNVMQRLRELGVRQIAIFTGDRLSVAKRVGTNIGVDAIEAECLPEEKHEQIQIMARNGQRTLMVGDGINDGPSLATADVGVAMGLSGSDIAANSAGVALMNDDLSRIPFLIEISRKQRAIVAQNIAASIVIVLVGLVLAATGVFAAAGNEAGTGLAGLYHFVGEIFVLGNSFRLFRFGEEFVTAEQVSEGIKRRAASVRGLKAQAA